jgi:hypothetical protein
MARRNLVAGLALGAVTAAAYMIGSRRSFGYDAAATFANFVATPSLWDAFAVRAALPSISLKTIASNDHVLLSLLSHVIYSLTGLRNEWVYRLIPALAAGGTVGVATAVLAKRFGLLAGVCAGLYIATAPLFVDNSRDLRGYSLAALLSLLATIMVLGSKWTRGRLIIYGLLLGLAIATHVFAAVVLLAHVAWIATKRSPALLKLLAPAWILALLIGAAANAYIELLVFIQHGFPPSLFDPTFPRDLVLFLLGAPALLPIGLWLTPVLLGLWVVRREPWVWASLAVLAVVVAVLWLVLQPAYLYPRFFIFVIPGIAYLMAAAIARWMVLAPVVALGAAAAIASQVPGYTQDPLALPQAAAVIERAEASGSRACVIHADEQVLAAYTTRFTVVTTAEQLRDCDLVVVVSWNVDLGVREEAAQQFPRRTQLPADYPAVVLER